MTKCSPFRYFKTSPEIIRLAVMMYVRVPAFAPERRRPAARAWHRHLPRNGSCLVAYRSGPMFAAEIRKRRIQGAFEQLAVAPRRDVRQDQRREALPLAAVDHEGEVLESFVTKTRDRKAAEVPQKSDAQAWTPCSHRDGQTASYGAALRDLGAIDRQRTGRWLNSRAENSHLPLRRRERALLRFRRMRSLQKFASVHSSVYNHFNQERSLTSRDHFKLNRTAALAEWRQLCSA